MFRHPSVLPPEGDAGGFHPPVPPNMYAVDCYSFQNSPFFGALRNYYHAKYVPELWLLDPSFV